MTTVPEAFHAALLRNLPPASNTHAALVALVVPDGVDDRAAAYAIVEAATRWVADVLKSVDPQPGGLDWLPDNLSSFDVADENDAQQAAGLLEAAAGFANSHALQEADTLEAAWAAARAAVAEDWHGVADNGAEALAGRIGAGATYVVRGAETTLEAMDRRA